MTETPWFRNISDTPTTTRTIISKKQLWDAIREKCIDCSAHSKKERALCRVHDCTLYPYRFGKPMTEKQLQKQIEKWSKFDEYGNNDDTE